MFQERYLLLEYVSVIMSLVALYFCESYVTTDQDITMLIDKDNCTQLFECVNLTNCKVQLVISNYSLTVLETKGNNSVEFNDSDSSLCLSSPFANGQFSTCAKVNATVEPSTTRCWLLNPFLNDSMSYLLFTIEFENSTCRLINSRRTNCDNNLAVDSVGVSASLEQTILATRIKSSEYLTFLTSSSESATAIDVLNESYVTTSQSSQDITLLDSTFSADHLQSLSITGFVLESTSPTTPTLSASSPSSVADTVLSGLGISGSSHTVDVIDLTNSIRHDNYLTLTDSTLEPTSVMSAILTTVALESKIPHDSSTSFIESENVHVSPSTSNVESLQIKSSFFSLESTHNIDSTIFRESPSIPFSHSTSNFESLQTNSLTFSIVSTSMLYELITSTLKDFSVDDLSAFPEVTATREFQFLTTKSLTAGISVSSEIKSSVTDETTSFSTFFDLSMPVSRSASYSSTVYKVTQSESPLFSSSLYPMAHLTTATNPESVQVSATRISVNSSWNTNESTDQIKQTTEAITPSLISNTLNSINIFISTSNETVQGSATMNSVNSSWNTNESTFQITPTASLMSNTFNNINIFISTSTENFNTRKYTSIEVSTRDQSTLSLVVHPLTTLTTSESLALSEFTAFVQASSNVYVFSSFTSMSSHQSMTLIGVSSTDLTSKQNNITTLDNVTSYQKVTLKTVLANDTVFDTMTTLDPTVTFNMSVFASTLGPSDDTIPIVLGVVLGSVALSVLTIFLCMYVKHRKRSQLATRAQRYKTYGFRNWKSTKSNTSGSDQTSLDHVPLSDYSPMHSKEYVGNDMKSNVESSGTNIDNDNNPLFDKDTLPNQEDGVKKAADFGRLRADVIIAGLNNNIQGKNKPRKIETLNLENIQLNDLRTRDNTKSDSNVHPLILGKNEIKLKAIAHGKSRQSRDYTDIVPEVFDKGNTRARPTSCDVYTTISEVDTGSIRYQYFSLYDKAREPETEVANPEPSEHYSTIATESNQRKITSNKAVNQRNSELSTDRTSFNGSSLYEDINIFETKEVDSSQAEGNQAMYSILGQESRDRLNTYNSLPFQKEGMDSDSEYPEYIKQASSNTSGQVQPVYNKLFTTDVLKTDGHIYNQHQQEGLSLADKSKSENVLPSSNESQKRSSDIMENGETVYFILEPGSQYD